MSWRNANVDVVFCSRCLQGETNFRREILGIDGDARGMTCCVGDKRVCMCVERGLGGRGMGLWRTWKHLTFLP